MLKPGAKLGSYEIAALIGAGGMGEVYEARDTKLGRNVAIKILPANFVNDPERLSRFQREARMLAALNHPNIATIYGLEQSDGVHCLVMELVSGETLAGRLKAGPQAVEEALKIAVQIAEALEAAHEKGIVHRDLKPANIKITPEGKVKVLDFGLAKAFAGDAASSDPSESPTLGAAATAHGVILGTAAYMSPEQARGKAVDKRTDIWAFGCVLYELVTGKQAFQGETVTDILAKVLQGEPDWQLLPRATPPQIRHLLRRCLQKDRTLRLQAAGDARIEIQEALMAPATAESSSVAATPPVKGWRRAVPLSIAGLSAVILAVVASITVWNLKPAPAPPPKPVSRLTITLPPGDQLAGLNNSAIALSPDGSQLAYVAIRGGRQQIYLRALDSLEARPIAGTEGASSPFFSPDGQWLGFFAAGKLKKVSANGGAAQILSDAATPAGASWGTQGTIAFGDAISGSLQQVPDAGGSPQPLTRLEKGEAAHVWPEFLPGSKAVLFAAGTAADTRVAVFSIGKGQRRDLIPGATHPQYVPSGQLVYVQQGTLMAVPFDPQRLAVTGAAVPVLEGVLESSVRGAAQYSISPAGSLVYIPGGVQGFRRLVWAGRNGAEQPLAAPAHAYDSPRISPDGRKIAVSIDGQIWLYDLSRDTLTRFTFVGNANNRPVWTPDGKRIAFYSNEEGPLNLFWQLADGSGGLERLIASENLNAPYSFSPDGQLLAFNDLNPTTRPDIWVLRLSDRKAQPFLRTPFSEGAARFSPDGHWLAYISDESGRYEVYVQPYPGPGGKWQISTEGGTEPVWNPNGRELFYRSGDKMMAVEVTTQPSFAVGKPRVLFTGEYVPASVPVANYDVSPDGQRFLMVKPSEQTASLTQIVVVQNWFEELKRRVPAK